MTPAVEEMVNKYLDGGDLSKGFAQLRECELAAVVQRILRMPRDPQLSLATKTVASHRFAVSARAVVLGASSIRAIAEFSLQMTPCGNPSAVAFSGTQNV